MECTCQGNDFELIPIVEMETIHSIKGNFGSEFPNFSLCTDSRALRNEYSIVGIAHNTAIVCCRPIDLHSGN